MRSDPPEVMEKDVTMATIQLTATTDEKGNVVIAGDRTKKTLPKGSGSHHFQFTLDDQTKLNVEFDTLDTEDNWSNCPPPGGMNSTQIPYEHVHIDALSASFKDKNDNNGPMDVCYRWNFKCDDAKQHPAFDPIIDNRGR